MIKIFILLVLLLTVPQPVAAVGPQQVPESTQPNFVVIFCDDLGYSDLSCFGSKSIATPEVDRLAREGMRFTDFYAQTVCGPSRAALMTGCYPLRVAIHQNRVEIHPHLHTKEVTLAEVLKRAGYATAAFGKWDLAGHSQTDFEPSLMPCHQGFDTFFGTPTSNDRSVDLYRDSKLIEKQADMSTLTRRYTDEAIDFINDNREKPFLVYLAHTMPHVRLAASEQFRGKSKGGLYGDVVEEIDWNAGRLTDTLEELGLDSNTYVIFTSDNGPWIHPGGRAKRRKEGGYAEPLRSGKTSAWDGGQRVPCVVWAPGRIPGGTTCGELASTLDFLPTFARLAGAEVPTDRVIDGHDISPLLHAEPGAKSPTKAFYFYGQTQLRAVRADGWKLMLPSPAQPPWWIRNWSVHIEPDDLVEIEEPLLYSYATDIGEQHDVAAEHPQVVERLLELAEWARRDIGDYNRVGENARFFDPEPRRPDAAEWATAPRESAP